MPAPLLFAKAALVVNLVASPITGNFVNVPLPYRICSAPTNTPGYVSYYDPASNWCAETSPELATTAKKMTQAERKALNFMYTRQKKCTATKTRTQRLLNCFGDIKPALAEDGCPIDSPTMTWTRGAGKCLVEYTGI